MTFSVFFWNIWYRNQVEGKAKYNGLLSELKRLIDEHSPDIVALAEVVCPSQDKSAPVIQYLQKLGYSYTHCTSMVQFDDYWMSGVALCSRFPITQKQKIMISENGYAAKRGHPGLDKEIISGQVTLLEGHDLQIIVAHPSDTFHSLTSHRDGMKNLSQLVHSKTYAKNTILVGDMNQWRLIPGSFRHKVADVMNSQTGSILKPTWLYNAHRCVPLRLNLDYMYWSKQSDFVLKDFKVLVSNTSDHRPLLATFELV